MSRIAIALNGKPLFLWEGDEAEIQRIFQSFPEGAAGVGMAANEMAMNCLGYLGKLGALPEQTPVGQEYQMMGVIWLIAQSDTGNPEHPGKVADYIGTTDFDADIRMEQPPQRGSTVNIAIIAKPKKLDS